MVWISIVQITHDGPVMFFYHCSEQRPFSIAECACVLRVRVLESVYPTRFTNQHLTTTLPLMLP